MAVLSVILPHSEYLPNAQHTGGSGLTKLGEESKFVSNQGRGTPFRYLDQLSVVSCQLKTDN